MTANVTEPTVQNISITVSGVPSIGGAGPLPQAERNVIAQPDPLPVEPVRPIIEEEQAAPANEVAEPEGPRPVVALPEVAPAVDEPVIEPQPDVAPPVDEPQAEVVPEPAVIMPEEAATVTSATATSAIATGALATSATASSAASTGATATGATATGATATGALATGTTAAEDEPTRRTRRSADQLVIEEAAVVPDRLRPRPSSLALLAIPEARVQQLAVDYEVPATFQEAMKKPEKDLWKGAADEEMAALYRTATYEEVNEEEWMDVIPCRFVLTTKRQPGGPIHSFKARCVCQGFRQEEGVNFWETFAPTSQADAIRLFITVCLAKNMPIHQMDVRTAFLNGDIDGEIYVRAPAPYFTPGRVWKLRKALYGLKQAPRCWKIKLDQIMAQVGYEPTKKDSCIYVKHREGSTSYVLSYVDDLLLASTDPAELEWLKKKLAEIIEIRDLGEIGTFLGIQFTRSADGSLMELSQQHYIEALAHRFRMERERRVKKQPPLHTIDLTNTDPAKINQKLPYRELVGALLYISNHTRPDIAASMSLLSQHLDYPTKKVWTYAKQVLGYLMHTKSQRLILGNLDGSNLVAFADANFAPRPDRKSQSGVVLKLAGSSIVWFSRKQKLVSTATAEAEFIAMGMSLKKITWAQQLLEELNFPVIYPTPLMEDNMPALNCATGRKDTELTKSIDIKFHAIQDLQRRKFIDVIYIESEDQIADALTKVPSRPEMVHQLLGCKDGPTCQNRGCVERILPSASTSSGYSRAH